MVTGRCGKTDTSDSLADSSESVSPLYFLHRGFSVSTDNKMHIFKPVSVQAMWWVLFSFFPEMHKKKIVLYFI